MLLHSQLPFSLCGERKQTKSKGDKQQSERAAKGTSLKSRSKKNEGRDGSFKSSRLIKEEKQK